MKEKTRRELVTTASERNSALLELEAEPLFLGSWCFSRGHKNSEGRQEVVDYHWAHREKAHSDWELISGIVKTALPVVARELNRIHGVNYSTRAWDIVIGRWLIQFATVLFDRLRQLEVAVDTDWQLVSVLREGDHPYNPPETPNESTREFCTDSWNHEFIGTLMELYFPEIELVRVTNPSKKLASEVRFGTAEQPQRRAKKVVKSLLQVMLDFRRFTLGSVPKKYVVTNTSLSPSQSVALAFGLDGHVVLNPDNPEPAPSKYSPEARHWKLPNKNCDSRYELALRLLIPRYLPRCLLEGFDALQELAEQSFPREADVVFTASDHNSAMAFKLWMAAQVDFGTRLVVGQHGGGALHKMNASIDWEIGISDYYLVNGPGILTQPNFKVAGQFWSKLSCRKKPSGEGALMVTGLMPRYVFELRSMPLAGEMEKHIENEIDLYSRLPPAITSQLRVRLYPKGDYGWENIDRWRTKFPNVKLDVGRKSFDRSVRSSRLVIVTYQASTYAETLAANYPTVIYWDSSLWEIADAALDQIRELQTASILHDSAASAADHVASIWADIDGWWYSTSVQAARANFCELYAVRYRHSGKRLAELLGGIPVAR